MSYFFGYLYQHTKKWELAKTTHGTLGVIVVCGLYGARLMILDTFINMVSLTSLTTDLISQIHTNPPVRVLFMLR